MDARDERYALCAAIWEMGNGNRSISGILSPQHCAGKSRLEGLREEWDDSERAGTLALHVFWEDEQQADTKYSLKIRVRDIDRKCSKRSGLARKSRNTVGSNKSIRNIQKTECTIVRAYLADVSCLSILSLIASYDRRAPKPVHVSLSSWELRI